MLLKSISTGAGEGSTHSHNTHILSFAKHIDTNVSFGQNAAVAVPRPVRQTRMEMKTMPVNCRRSCSAPPPSFPINFHQH